MIIPQKKRLEYWNHFIARWVTDHEGGGHGVTGPRLRKIRAEILFDDYIWQDVILRHNGLDIFPEEMELTDRNIYDHCLGNFWGMVYQNMVYAGLLG